jgi:hypothetical protein
MELRALDTQGTVIKRATFWLPSDEGDTVDTQSDAALKQEAQRILRSKRASFVAGELVLGTYLLGNLPREIPQLKVVPTQTDMVQGWDVDRYLTESGTIWIIFKHYIMTHFAGYVAERLVEEDNISVSRDADEAIGSGLGLIRRFARNMVEEKAKQRVSKIRDLFKNNKAIMEQSLFRELAQADDAGEISPDGGISEEVLYRVYHAMVAELEGYAKERKRLDVIKAVRGIYLTKGFGEMTPTTLEVAMAAGEIPRDGFFWDVFHSRTANRRDGAVNVDVCTSVNAVLRSYQPGKPHALFLTQRFLNHIARKGTDDIIRYAVSPLSRAFVKRLDEQFYPKED